MRSFMSYLRCMNRWTTIQFVDGSMVQVFVTNANFQNASGFVTRGSYKTLTCDGQHITNEQQAQNCMNRWVQVGLPNGVTISLFLTSYSNEYIGGTLQVGELTGLAGHIASVNC